MQSICSPSRPYRPGSNDSTAVETYTRNNAPLFMGNRKPCRVQSSIYDISVNKSMDTGRLAYKMQNESSMLSQSQQ